MPETAEQVARKVIERLRGELADANKKAERARSQMHKAMATADAIRKQIREWSAHIPPTAEELCHCHAGRDGDCGWVHCPQIRDGEPARSGRHCPLDRGEYEA